jgi:hypothetical protein
MRAAMRSSDARTQRVPVEEALRRRRFGREGSGGMCFRGRKVNLS